MDAIRKLGEPETESRSLDFNGRRMIRIDGGFLILNYMKYRDKDYTAKDRMARLRARRKQESVTRDCNAVTRNVTQAESRVHNPSPLPPASGGRTTRRQRLASVGSPRPKEVEEAYDAAHAANDRKSYAMWQGMSEKYREQNPWIGEVPA